MNIIPIKWCTAEIAPTKNNPIKYNYNYNIINLFIIYLPYMLWYIILNQALFRISGQYK